MSEPKNVVMFKPELVFGTIPADNNDKHKIHNFIHEMHVHDFSNKDNEIHSTQTDSDKLKPRKGERIDIFTFSFLCPCCEKSFFIEFTKRYK